MLAFKNEFATAMHGSVFATISPMNRCGIATLPAPAGSSVFLRQGDPQGFHLPEEGGFVDSQFPGSGKAIVPVAPERLTDGLCLHGPNGVVHFPPFRRRGNPCIIVLRQVPGLDPPFGAQNKGMFDDVFQFPDIAGIVVGHEKRQNLGAYARDRFALYPVPPGHKMIDQQGDVFLSFSE